jgi:hypothetical protein
VEGLPIVAGPSVDVALGRDVRVRAGAVGVLRTARSISGECCDLGYNARVELRLGDRRPLALMLRAFDLVAPVEDWGLHANEVGWEAFLVRRDYRDYYRNNGRRDSAGGRRRLALGFEVRRERQGTLAARDPWTLSRTGRPGAPTRRSTTAIASFTQHHARLAQRPGQPDVRVVLRGWLDITRSNDPRGVRRSHRAADTAALAGACEFARAFLDLRRYNRIGGANRLNFRLVLGGWAGGDPLPLQNGLDRRPRAAPRL